MFVQHEWEEACRMAARRHSLKMDLWYIGGILVVALVFAGIYLR